MIVDLTKVDLTGNDPSFFRPDERRMVFREDQIIEFNEPVYAESIHVFMISSEGTHELTDGVDYEVPNAHSDMVDEFAISEAKICVNDEATGTIFNKLLVKGIKIIREFVSDYQISIQYQAFYRKPTDYVGNGTGPDYSRALMKEVIDRIHYLENVKNPVESITTADVADIRPLDEDLTATAESNFIQYEEHRIDVPNNIYAIRPLYGTFYDTEDLVVTFNGSETRTITEEDLGKSIFLEETGGKLPLTESNISQYVGKVFRIYEDDITLVRDVDYFIRGIDHIRTRIANTSAGVYDRIIISKKLKGTVKVTYHAFGGEVTIKDIWALKHAVISLYTNLENGRFLTEDSLKALPVLASLIQRVDHIEDLCHIVSPYQFRYLYRVLEGNSDDLWVDVAKLYNDSWTRLSGVPTLHSEEFCLSNEALNYCAYFNLKHNLDLGKLEVCHSRIAASSFSSAGVDYFDLRKTPKFRIVYDENDLSKGIVLQISIINKNEGDGAWQIRAVKGSESAWSIIDSNGGVKGETSLTTELPDGSVWDITSNSVTNIAVLSDPYTFFYGSIPLSMIDAASYRDGEIYDNEANGTDLEDEPGKVELEGYNLPIIMENNAFNLASVKGFRFHIFDRYVGNMIIQNTGTITSVSTESISSDVIYFPLDLCSIEGILTFNEGKFTFKVKSHTGLNSLLNERFDLRQVDFIF